MNQKIKFSFNLNNKLNTQAFTTIRQKNETYYKIGNVYDVVLKKEVIKEVELIDVKHFRLVQLNEFMARLDTGYSLEETINVINIMYPQTKNDETAVFSLLLLKTLVK